MNCVSLKTTSSTHEESNNKVEKMEEERNPVGSRDREMKDPQEVERIEGEIEAMDTAEVNVHVLGDQDHDKMAANTEEKCQQHPKKHHK